MNNYNKYKEESFFQYLDANNLYGWAMSQMVLNGKKICQNLLKSL